MNFSALLQIILTLFLLIACGVICRKTGIIDNVASKNLSALIIKVGQPMMIIAALAKQQFNEENLKLAIIGTVSGIAMHVILAAMAYGACLPIPNRDRRNISEFALIFANCGFLGFPIMDALFGDKGLLMAAFYVIGFNLMIWTWGLAVVGRGKDNIKITPKKMFLNFGTVPCAIGLAVFLSKMPFSDYAIPSFLMNFLNYLGNLCTPISVLLTGALLATVPLKQMIRTWEIYYTSFIKLIAMPLIVCLVGHLCRLPDDICLFCTAMAALPSATSVTMFCELYDIEEAPYASQIVGSNSLLCLGTLPLIMFLADLIIQI